MTDAHELAAIAEAIEHYFQGMYHSNAERLGQAFHESAFVGGYDEGRLIHIPADKFIDFVSRVPPPADQGEAFDMEIVAVDVTGEVAAVKVADLYRGMRYIDYLTLLKIDGRWGIVNKTFHQEPRA